MVNVLEQLKENYIFAVIRGNSAKDAIEISKYSILGGVKNIEVTYTTPDASKAIVELKKLYSNNTEIVIGAGTIMNVELAKEAISSGAQQQLKLFEQWMEEQRLLNYFLELPWGLHLLKIFMDRFQMLI